MTKSFCVLAICALFAASPALAANIDDDTPTKPAAVDDWEAGKSSFKAGNWRSAIDSLDRVVSRQPGNANAHNMLGYAWRQIGNYDEALDHYRQALTANPNHRGALEYRGEAYLKLGRIEEAKADMQRLAQACESGAGASTGGWGDDTDDDCQELENLQQAFAEHGVAVPVN